MAQVAWQELNFLQMLDVLRSAQVLRLAVSWGESPYVVPVHGQLEMRGLQPVIHLLMPAQGRKADALKENSRVCLETEAPGCAWLDTVIVTGTAELTLLQENVLHAAVAADTLTGRRYFRHE